MLNWRHFSGNSDAWNAQVLALGGGLYQSHAWGEYKAAGGGTISRLLGADSTGSIKTVCQILSRRRIFATVCWIPGGPSGDLDVNSGELPGCIKQEFGRLTYCRANLQRRTLGESRKVLRANNWRRPSTRLRTGLSVEIDLTVDASARLAGSSSNWRQNLKRSSKYDLVVEQWHSSEINQMTEIYMEMSERKCFPEQHSHESLTKHFRTARQQLITFRCIDKKGELLAFRTAICFGSKAMDMLDGATVAARKVYDAAHATLWALLDACKNAGLMSYDMRGIDPENNKGVYDFKQGTGAQRLEYLGEWEWSEVPCLSGIVDYMMKRNGVVM